VSSVRRSEMDDITFRVDKRINVDRELRREQNSLFNCLHSIADDARFIAEIRSLYPSLPVFANLRCGLWYQKHTDGTCYFKSTDGHFSQWSFSTTRLNLQVAEACAKHGGCIIIDATRRGKRFPVRYIQPLLTWPVSHGSLRVTACLTPVLCAGASGAVSCMLDRPRCLVVASALQHCTTCSHVELSSRSKPLR
jgi:hypothetical protein